MKRRDFIKATGIGVAGATIAAPAIAQSAPEIKQEKIAQISRVGLH